MTSMLSPEGRREPDEQRRGLWYRTLPAYVVAAAIWMALLGLLYLYFVLRAPQELKGELRLRSDSVASCTSMRCVQLEVETSVRREPQIR